MANNNNFGALSSLYNYYSIISRNQNELAGDMEAKLLSWEESDEAQASSPLDTNNQVDRLIDSAVMWSACNNNTVLSFSFNPLEYLSFGERLEFKTRLNELGISEYAIS